MPKRRVLRFAVTSALVVAPSFGCGPEERPTVNPGPPPEPPTMEPEVTETANPVGEPEVEGEGPDSVMMVSTNPVGPRVRPPPPLPTTNPVGGGEPSDDL